MVEDLGVRHLGLPSPAQQVWPDPARNRSAPLLKRQEQGWRILTGGVWESNEQKHACRETGAALGTSEFSPGESYCHAAVTAVARSAGNQTQGLTHAGHVLVTLSPTLLPFQ